MILQGGRDISIVQPPPLLSVLPVTARPASSTALPLELIQTMNYTFFIHLLATDSGRILPPGKSLLSMMSAPRTNAQSDGELPKLEDRVKDLVHKAFWNEALESLSDPSPAIQLPRLKRLYEDILSTISPLLPRHHPILGTLAAPLSPTSDPSRLAIMHLREILVALRERCSPARDPVIDGLIRVVDEPSDLASPQNLAQRVTDAARGILELSEVMKEDLSQFVLGAMDEKDLKMMVTQHAMLREKALVLHLWPPSRLEPSWKTWIRDLDVSLYPDAEPVHPPHRRWSFRLVQALGSGSPVSCPLPTLRAPGSDGDNVEDMSHDLDKPLNIVPPPFFVTCPALFAAQNHLQALVIAASLRSLVRLPPQSRVSADDAAQDNSASFSLRIWTLLKGAADEESGSEDTKVVNLADEVVRMRRACAEHNHPCPPEEEARLRAAVDRTLQPRDPVFLLLQKRLLQALATWLVSSPAPAAGDHGASTPIHMQTGREMPGKRPRLHHGLENPQSVFVGWERERGRVPHIKGFEDDVLAKEVGETFKRVGRVADWTDRVWQDLIETGEIGGSNEKVASEHEAGTTSTSK
ncbi:hypothetical protein C8Q80DRAFT_1106612 [Daedaleopsis nitida]|nr:hypothetical protein C8Q80DRAFT_1106612 [Daedaleopsis nitida]